MKSRRTLPVAILIGSFVIAMAIIINALIQFIIAQQPEKLSSEKAYENISYVKVTDSPTMGNPNAPITVIEYTDFDCPICKKASDDIMPGLKKEYIDTGKVRFVFKSLPIDNLHPNAFRKTEASLCVREMGGDKAFFSYYDQLFTMFGFSINLDDTLTNLAQAQNLDPVAFRTCLKSGKFAKRIRDEVTESIVINSIGTPTWLIGKTQGDGISDAVKLNGLVDYESFKSIVDKTL